MFLIVSLTLSSIWHKPLNAKNITWKWVLQKVELFNKDICNDEINSLLSKKPANTPFISFSQKRALLFNNISFFLHTFYLNTISSVTVYGKRIVFRARTDFHGSSAKKENDLYLLPRNMECDLLISKTINENAKIKMDSKELIIQSKYGNLNFFKED